MCFFEGKDLGFHQILKGIQWPSSPPKTLGTAPGDVKILPDLFVLLVIDC